MLDSVVKYLETRVNPVSRKGYPMKTLNKNMNEKPTYMSV